MAIKIIGKPLNNIPWEERKNSNELVWRYSNNPIITWNPIPGVSRIFNSAVIPYKGGFAGVFRADALNVRPSLHFGTSADGLHWDINPEKIKWVDKNGKPTENSYAYDPRLVEIDNEYFITWCDDMNGPSIGLGKTTDFKTFVKMENPLIPFNRNGVLFPRKINGKYVLLSRPSDNGHTPFGDIFLSQSPDMNYWGEHRVVMKRDGFNWWENVKIGAGPIPIETSEGWLMVYHGVTGTCNGFVYSFGGAILDINNPEKVLYRAKNYILTPQKDYEVTGFVPNVAFPCASLVDPESGKMAIYYGAADTHTAVAFCNAFELIDYIKSSK